MRLKAHGLQTLLVSISPFHNEFIPFKQVQSVIAACRQANIGTIPWITDFYSDLEGLNPNSTHAMAEFESRYGADYLPRLLGRYWIHMGGRALATFRPVLPNKTLEQILAGSQQGCIAELTDTSHFHIDLYGNYIPGLCSGLAIAQHDLGRHLDAQSYPFISTLARHGIKGLYDLARRDFGFTPFRPGYINKCDLCTDIRTSIVQRHSDHFPEFQPEGFYGRHSSSGKAASSGSM